jgi:hypothetical protein
MPKLIDENGKELSEGDVVHSVISDNPFYLTSIDLLHKRVRLMPEDDGDKGRGSFEATADFFGGKFI